MQIRKLSKHLKEMNELLEKILRSQFGIDDKRWLDAIQDIENGFSRAVNSIAQVKGKRSLPIVLTKKDIGEILKD